MAVAISNTGGAIAGVAASGNVATYSSVSIGTAATDRIVVVCIGTELTSSSPTAVTIDYGTGALSMTAAEGATIGAVNSDIFYLAAPTGTTATIAVTFGSTNPTGAQNRIAVFRVVGANATPTDTGQVADTDADPISSGALSVPTNGGGIAICADATDTTARTWTGFTEDQDVDAGDFRFSTGTLTGAASPTITVSGGNAEDGALSWIIFGPLFNPTQTSFRFYADGTESGSTAIAAQDTNIDRNYNDIYHIRFRVQEAGGASGTASDDYKIRVSENGGSYIDVANSTKAIVSAGGLTDGSATTNRLGAGTGSFVAGQQDDGNNLVENIQLTASNYTEHVFCQGVLPAGVVHNDTLDYRLQVDPNGAGYTDFSSYTQTPRVTVKRAAFTQAAFRFYEDGTESGSTAVAAQNTNIVRNTTTTPKIHIRFRLQETNGFSDHPTGTPFKLMVSKNGAAYGTLDTSDWSIDTLSGLADDNATTERLTGGTGSFYAGLQEDSSSTGQTVSSTVPQASNYTEFVWAIEATGAGAFVNDNTYDFKMIIVSRLHPTLGTDFDSYAQVPRITITGGASVSSLIFTPNYYLQPLLVR